MALTQISTAGVKDDLVTAAKIADDAVTEALVADESVDEARLKISNAGTNGQYLQKQSGNTGGLTWADVPAGVGGATGVTFNDGVVAKWGTGNDLEIYHDATGPLNYIKTTDASTPIQLQAPGGEALAKFIPDGAAELYHNGVKKLETQSLGVNITGNVDFNDDGKVRLGTASDLQIYHDGSHSYIHDNGTGALKIRTNELQLLNAAGDEYFLSGVENGGVNIYYDNTLRFQTYAGGCFFAAELTASDNSKIKLGSGADFEIYHDGSHSYVANNTGDLYLIQATDQGNGIFLEPKPSEAGVKIFRNGAVELYNDNSKKFATYANGTYTYGECNISAAEGVSAELYLIADEGDDNGDIWRMISNHDINDLTFSNNSTGSFVNLLTLTKDGNLYAGYTELTHGTSTALYVNCNTTGDVDGAVFRHARGGLSGYSGKMMTFKGNDGTDEGSIVIGTTTTTYNTSSDYRLKENEVTISDGITRLKQLKPYQFNFKREPGVKVDGFFAHEVDAIIPYSVSGEKDAVKDDGSIDPQQIDHSTLVPLLTAALQEAIAKIETLETKVAALEAA